MKIEFLYIITENKVVYFIYESRIFYVSISSAVIMSDPRIKLVSS